MEEVIIRIDSETLGTDGPDKQLLGRLSILNYHEDDFQKKLNAVTDSLRNIYEGYIDGSITITVINKFEHVNV
tara:strand:+ start:1914 stop:2132 length:219 start_codon:yes stop_codon:yes gene_type:complete